MDTLTIVAAIVVIAVIGGIIYLKNKDKKDRPRGTPGAPKEDPPFRR